uniref:Phospholipase D n=1 Tax=Oryza punctata TaxID=4537 RepID=A0A0E0LUQ0_ORYPU
MAQRLLHGVMEAKILEAKLSPSSVASDYGYGQRKLAANSQSQKLPKTKLLSLIMKLPIIFTCQRFDKSTDQTHHGDSKRLVYATIGMDAARVARTRATDQPQWKEEPLHVYCAHDASNIVFTVVVTGGGGSGDPEDVVGQAYLPADDVGGGKEVDQWLPLCDEKRKPLEGLDKIHVQLRFIDVLSDVTSRWGKGVDGPVPPPPYTGLPRAFFGQHRGCKVTLYQDAHVLPPLAGSRCWEDVFDAVANARRLVYIAGWSVSTDVALVRDPRRPAQTLGHLLKSKAGERVAVLLLVWDDQASTGLGAARRRDGRMAGAHGEDTASYFRGTGVHCVVCPRDAVFTHHQKAVVADGPRGLVAFLGGIDLCGGRYDTQEHPLFRTLTNAHRDDFHQPSFPGASVAKGGPREPWHDVHCRIEGPAAWDVLDNFEQRWRRQGGGEALLAHLPRSSAAREVVDQDAQEWHVQVFRSIDSRAVDLFPDNAGEAARCGLVTGATGDTVERSIQDGYIHAIRRAKYFIYIESQCFLGSSYGWNRDVAGGAATAKNDAAPHTVPKELSLKLASKIRAGDSFRVYVVLPMWPEGVPESATVQAILDWQRRTMEMMYKDVAAALAARGSTQNPREYLSFFCLGNRETYVPGEHSPPERPELDSDYMRAQQARRFKINVNANIMIVDDEYIIVGSANVNQRSMDGGRDTEMAMGAYQPRHLDTPNTWPRGQVHQFRLALWREHLGQAAFQAAAGAGDDMLYPTRSGCMNRVNQAARQHWEMYASDKFQGSLPGHLMLYPVGVGDRGELWEAVPFFPDTKAKVFGCSSDELPPVLTT